MADASNFEILEWYPAYQSCQKYFLDHAQHEASVHATAALVNISLPFQWASHPVQNSLPVPPPGSGPGVYPFSFPPQQSYQRSPFNAPPPLPTWVSLVPYVRRLVVTGFDSDGILHGFFGNDWRKGIGPIQECERRNYLFAAKSIPWAQVKSQYDGSGDETVPFLKPLQRVQLVEIESAEKLWSQWLAMEDWMVGPRAPESMDEGPRDEAGLSR
jgi:hypothetical protein